MYMPISQLKQYDSEEKEFVTSRWETKEGEIHHKYITELIRKGGGEHFLEWDFQSGMFNGCLKDDYDLRGFTFWEEDILFPRADNINALDFSCSNFWHSTFRNACWHASHLFVQFYNCKFINCQFHNSYFLGCKFENCEFEHPDFIQGCMFDNCDFVNSNFSQLFTSNKIFNDCRFSSTVTVSSPKQKPNDALWKINFDKKILKDFYISVRDAYQSGGAHDEEWNYYYLAKHAGTRHNNRNALDKCSKLLFQEYLMGYGEKPIRCLLVSLFFVFVFSILFMYSGFLVSYNDASGNVLNQVVAYDISLPYFIENFFNFEFHAKWLSDFASSFYFSILTFTSVGTSEITPINKLGRVYLVAEIILGVTLIAGWVATLFRKLIR